MSRPDAIFYHPVGYHPASPNKSGRGYEGMFNAFANTCGVCGPVGWGYSEGCYWHSLTRQYLCFDHFAAMVEIDGV